MSNSPRGFPANPLPGAALQHKHNVHSNVDATSPKHSSFSTGHWIEPTAFVVVVIKGGIGCKLI